MPIVSFDDVTLPSRKNVLIVGRTKMSGTTRCIGGITADGESIRLLNSKGGHWDSTEPVRIGDIWDVTYTPVHEPVHPHTEDVLVSRWKFVGTQANLRAHLLSRVNPCRGSIYQLYGGMLGFTANNSSYICHRRGVPPYSTCFWVPDRDLTLRAGGKHYDYTDQYGRPRGVSYVGEPQALPRLPAGTLVRLSLARWWRPEDAGPDFEERCYVQLSGWFL
jgi:hypothetical protein